MIRRIRIQNFKSLADVSVELGSLNVLIGKSGTGKSNFVEALRFLRSYLDRGRDGVKEFGGKERVYCRNLDSSEIRFELDFDLPGSDQLAGYSLVIGEDRRNGPFCVLEETLRIRGPIFQVKFEGSSGNWGAPKPAPSVGDNNTPVLGRLRSIEEAIIAHVFLTKSLGCYDFPGNVFLQPKQNGPSESLGGLRDDGSNFLSVLSDISSDLEQIASKRQILSAIRRLNSSVNSIEANSHINPNRVLVVHRFGDHHLEFDLAQESEGFRRFYAHLIALYQTPRKQVLVFEEPEKGIFPGALATLAEEFQSSADSGRSQIILTTHSPQLLDHFSPESIRVVEMKDGGTQIGPLAEEQLKSLQQDLLEPGELLTVDPARAA